MATAGEPPTTWIPANTFASRLVQIRHNRGLSQVEAARRCGLDDGSWSNWERGSKPRDMERVVKKICRGFAGVNRDWLAFGEVPPEDRVYATEESDGAPIILDMSPYVRELQSV